MKPVGLPRCVFALMGLGLAWAQFATVGSQPSPENPEPAGGDSYLAVPSAVGAVDYGREVQPLLATHCYSCHGPEKQKSGLRLDRRADAFKGGDSGPVIVPGKSAESRLIQLVAGVDPDKIMPAKGPRLTARQVGLLRAWIDRGATWPDSPPAALASSKEGLWSIQPLTRPPLPKVRESGWARNPVDRFILASLERAGLAPSPEADRRTLIRRLAFDLTGLPPAPDEVEQFVADRSPDAYERLVDRLLAAPQYGERWARHWLDVARYTESQGFEYDHMRENAWQFRDYVVASFNEDKPYDCFMKEQIAGDVLPPVTRQGIIATSFLVCGPWDQAGNSQANATQRLMTREEELEDILSVVSQTFLGLTVNCARCHAHKFDPIPQEDYYRIKAVFEGVQHGDAPILLPAEKQHADQTMARLKEFIATIEVQVSDIEKRGRQEALAALQDRALTSDEIASFRPAAEETVSRDELLRALSLSQRQELQALSTRLAEARQSLDAARQLPISYVGLRKQPEPTHRLKRGDVRTPLEIVRPGGLSALSEPAGDFGLPADAPEAERRLNFAHWLADPRNPLPARVLVNRLWHYHFGQGLVATPNDFGSSGGKPSHPELLDWLASQLLERQWSIKAVQRLIVCSSAYRQSSAPPAAAFEKALQLDAENRLLWRFTPQRLEAEALRDAILSVSGQINLAEGGPSFRPFETKEFNATFYFPKDKLGPEFDRRTIYRMNINSGKDPMLDAFDCPEPSVKTPRRGITTTPLQALSMMNSSFVQRQAGHLAERVVRRAQGETRRAIALAYRSCFAREASNLELDRAERVAREAGLPTVCWALLNSSEFLYVN